MKSEKSDIMIYELVKELGMSTYEMEYFKHSKLVKQPVFHKKTNQLELALEIQQTLPFAVFDVFKSKMLCYFMSDIQFSFAVVEPSYDVVEINKYVKHLFEQNNKFHVFMKAFPSLQQSSLVYRFANEIDVMNAQEFSHALHKALSNYGMSLEILCEELPKAQEVKVVKASALPTSTKVVETYQQEKKSFTRKKISDYTMTKIEDVEDQMREIKVEGIVFQRENDEMANGNMRQTLYISDYERAIIVQRYEGGNLTREVLNEINKGDKVLVYGHVQFSTYFKENVIKPVRIDKLRVTSRSDEEEVKRVELHVHTKFSEMDGISDIAQYITQADAWGHDAIAITDHNVVQAYPQAQHTVSRINKARGEGKTPFKMIYGIEMTMFDPKLNIVRNVKDVVLEDAQYCIFDLETTGLSCKYDHIIEFGAQIVDQRSVVGSKQMFIKPPVPLSLFTSELTGIQEDDVQNALPIEECIDEILEFIGDRILVAHNAEFDVPFLNEVLMRLGREPLNNPVIDTLDLDRSLHRERKAHRLGNVARLYGIKYDEGGAHRADYDANVLVEVFLRMLNDMPEVKTLHDLANFYDDGCMHKVRPKHVTLLALNAAGMKEIFELVSLSHIKYLAQKGKSGSTVVAEARIPRHEIERVRQNGNILIGSSCQNSEVFEMAQNRGDDILLEVMKFYDYIEIQPLDCYMNLVYRQAIPDVSRLKEIVRRIVDCARQLDKLIIASGDVHYNEPVQKRLRDVYISAQATGGIRHPLFSFRKSANQQAPNQHFKTTREMLDDFTYLGEQEAYEFVVENTNKIKDMVEVMYPIKDSLYPPHIDGCAEKLSTLCYDNAHKKYGEVLPEIVEKRLKKELDSIIGNGFEVVYYVSHLLVKKSLDDGYLVGSRGSVGSSFAATMSEITEVNPLSPHYVCPVCKFSEFFTDGSVASGYDLPDKPCPKCGANMDVDGQDIPFETFLGFEGDKVPDIDLNFSGDYQPTAHAYTKEVFGEKYVYRAGTIGTVAEKTAYGYVKGYYEGREMEDVSDSQVRFLAEGCAGVKRGSGQHPGGILVIPEDMDVHDFTPVQYPANDATSEWKTTHLDFHSIHDNVLKFDILGHVDPTAMKMLEKLSGIDVRKIPMNDPSTMSIFGGVDALDIDTSKNSQKTGAAGIPEFGTSFVRGILELTRPTTFDELVKISGLSHGTDVWLNNAKDLVDAGICTLKQVIGCRDDIMVYLMHKGLEPKLAFTIMESVRKGKGLIEEWENAMSANGVEPYYIESCKKIKYMFPKAHAVAYVTMAVRIAYFKVHMPIYYYCMFFSLRCDAYDIASMIKGENAIRARLSEIQMKMNGAKHEVTKKDLDTYSTLEVALEMVLRGYRFSNIDVMRSDATAFIPDPLDEKKIIPPFTSIDGLGENVAYSVLKAREHGGFISKQDLSQRTSLNGTNIKKLEELQVLKDLQDENQLSLF